MRRAGDQDVVETSPKSMCGSGNHPGQEGQLFVQMCLLLPPVPQHVPWKNRFCVEMDSECPLPHEGVFGSYFISRSLEDSGPSCLLGSPGCWDPIKMVKLGFLQFSSFPEVHVKSVKGKKPQAQNGVSCAKNSQNQM